MTSPNSNSSIQNYDRGLGRDKIVDIVDQIKRSTQLQDEISKIEDHLNKRPPFLRVKQSKKKIISVSKHTVISKYDKLGRDSLRYGTHIYQNNLAQIDQDSELPPSSSPYYNKLISSQGVFKILKSKIPNVPSSVQQKWKTNSFTTVSIATFGRRKFKIKSISSLIAQANEIKKVEDFKPLDHHKQREILKSKSYPQASLQPKFLSANQQKISRAASDSGMKYLLSMKKSEDKSPSFQKANQQQERNIYRSSPSIESVDGEFVNKLKAFFTAPQTPNKNKKQNQNLNKKDNSGLKQYFFSKKANSTQTSCSSPKKKVIKKIDHNQSQKTPRQSPKKLSMVKNAGIEFRKTMTIKGNMRQKWTSASQSSTSSSSIMNENSGKFVNSKKGTNIRTTSACCRQGDKKLSLPELTPNKNSNSQSSQSSSGVSSKKSPEQSQVENKKKAYKFSRRMIGNPLRIFNSTVGVREQIRPKQPENSQYYNNDDDDYTCNKTNNNCVSNALPFNRKNFLRSSINKCLSARNEGIIKQSSLQ